MNSYFLPRPSLCGAILWQRRRSAVAITFSHIVTTWSLAGSLILLVQAMTARFSARFVAAEWRSLLLCLLLINIAPATVVRIGPCGVRAFRLFAPWMRTKRAPLGGKFYEDESETDDWTENDTPINRWNSYESLDDNDEWVSVEFPTLRPEATSAWLTEQLHRIEVQQLPTARVVEPQLKEQGVGR